MAISPRLSVYYNNGGGSITSCTTVNIPDATGAYNASNNTGGYGGINPDRADIGLLLFVNYKATAGDVVVTIDTYDPITVTTFTYDMTTNKDGWYSYLIVAADKWTAVPAYPAGTIVYHVPTTAHYYTAAGTSAGQEPGVAGDWTIATLANAESTVTPTGTFNDFLDCNADACIGNLASELPCDCCDDKSDEVNYLTALLLGAKAEFGKTNYTNAQEIMDNITTKCDSTDCINC